MKCSKHAYPNAGRKYENKKSLKCYKKAIPNIPSNDYK